MTTLINQTKIEAKVELTTTKIFANDFYDIKVVDVTKSTTTNKKTLTINESIKNFRFKIMTI